MVILEGYSREMFGCPQWDGEFSLARRARRHSIYVAAQCIAGRRLSLRMLRAENPVAGV